MANETYTLIQKTTLNASAASITFSSIPQTFTDLKIVVSARTDRAATDDYVKIALNGVTTNQTSRILYTVGTTVQSTTDTLIYLPCCGNTTTASTFGYSEFYIPNYTSTTNAKSLDGSGTNENNATAFVSYAVAGLWNPATQAAVTSIVLTSYYSSNFTQYSSFALYGVAKQGVNPVAGPKASGGDIITNDGTYWIHQFLTSGTFTPSSTLSCDYLVVAGGGGGGHNGGGGGAGGYKTSIGGSPLSATAQSYAITVGAGGVGGTTAGTILSVGQVGSNSVFNSITSTGGGGGGTGYGYNATAGGSGGGGYAGGSGGGAASPSGQGNAGGAGGSGFSPYSAGGGGGAGAVGVNGNDGTSTGGNGGAGLASTITGTSVTRAGGGGGAGYAVTTVGTGGTGGGGNAGTTGTNPQAGTVNTGGGGGGDKGATYAGGAGGSGIVIIRYAM